MRGLVSLAAVALATAGAAAQDEPAKPAPRFGVEVDGENYPQTNARVALRSVVRAIERRRIDYLVAQLTDPEFVDRRVQQYGGRFNEVVSEATAKLVDDPTSVKELTQFSQRGEWQEAGDTATVRLADVPGRQVFLRKIGNRWFLENRQRAEAPAPGAPARPGGTEK
jgi:hypothetical protein